MTSPYAQGPAPTATLIRTGRTMFRQSALGGSGCALVGAALLVMGILLTAGIIGDASAAGGIAVTVLGGFLLIMFCFVLRISWKSRNAFLCVDQVGLWVSGQAGQKVIPWDTLAGVGLYWSKPMGKGKVKQHSLELCPSGPIDRDHPVLWNLVRDEEPLNPSLPRLRYRVPVHRKDQEALVTAVQQYAGHLWLGEAEREPNHMGFPDVKGHRERTRGQG
ncbi:hypothetical protein [Streptomyces sp. NBC_01304]|uniref:hypothetical protein n=1 Tax=Streptomyces sp. NBC_01304 TaxID=2903818 RepID=UPI002E0F6FA4|nr:hypothetical protein OG430_32125 [Streptomyces sp. NBC_01304]